MHTESMKDGKTGLDDFLLSHSIEEFKELKKICLDHSIFKCNFPKKFSRDNGVQDDTSIVGPKTEIRAVATDPEIKDFDKRREIAEIIIKNLDRLGKFYKTNDGRCFYFYEVEKHLYEMEQRPFKQLVTDLFNLSNTETYFLFALDLTLSRIARHGELVEVQTLAFYDTRKDLLAVSDGAHGIWMHDSSGKWVHADNGKDGIIFLTEMESESWVPDFSNPGIGLTWLLERLNFSGNQLQVQDQRELFVLWLISLFFKGLHHTKPIPAFLGPQGSGKSTFCRFIGRLFLGPQFNVSGLRDDKEDSFIASITNRVFHAVDNADSRIKWLEDALARYATGETFRLRKLYSTNEEISYKARATLMLTSRDPHFRRADVSERLLPFQLSRLEEFRDEESLFSELYKMRPFILGDLLLQAAEAKIAVQSIPASKVGHRMADFASFGARIYKFRGKEQAWLEILNRLEKSQAEFASEGDSMIEVLKQCLDEGLGEEPIATGVLFKKCESIAKDQGFPFPRTPQAFGKKFWEMQRIIEIELKVKIVKDSSHAGKIEVSFIKIGDISSPLSPPSPVVVTEVTEETEFQEMK